MEKFWGVIAKIALIATIVAAMFAGMTYFSNIKNHDPGSETITPEPKNAVQPTANKDLFSSVIGMEQNEAYRLLVGYGYTVGTQVSEELVAEEGQPYYVIDVIISSLEPNYIMLELSKYRP